MPVEEEEETVVRVASEHVQWTAQPCANPPAPWGVFRRPDLLLLKDTRTARWNNRLEAPNRFVYVYPRVGRGGDDVWEKELVDGIRDRVESGRPLFVHLFATPGSRNEFYGEWIAQKLVPKGAGSVELVLYRLATQTPGLYPPRKPMRSQNEARHAELLARLLPHWVVEHEPETLLDLHEPTVVDGVARNHLDAVSRSYTCDFVLARGLARVCVESKYDEHGVTPEALSKARLLRDRTLTRVVFLVGHAEGDVRWLDLGEVRSRDEPRWLALHEFP
jgi:hypothetical protein